jgi:hypothetical protein
MQEMYLRKDEKCAVLEETIAARLTSSFRWIFLVMLRHRF